MEPTNANPLWDPSYPRATAVSLPRSVRTATVIERATQPTARWLRLDADGHKQAESIGYVEIPDDSVYVQDQHQVAKYTGSAELLRSVALPQPPSVEAISARLAALD